MITPYRFYWSKILPISYENYLSETEILELFRQKINEMANTLNEIERVFNEELSNTVETIVTRQLADFRQELQQYKSEITATVQQLNRDIDALQQEIERSKGELESEIVSLDQKHDADIAQLNEQILSILHDTSGLSDRIDTLYDSLTDIFNYVHSILPQFADELAFNRAYSDKQLSLAMVDITKMLSAMYYRIMNSIKTIIGNLSGNSILVHDGDHITMTLQHYIDLLEQRLDDLSGGLTALEFDQLGLTAEEFDSLGLTAFEFDNQGIRASDLPAKPFTPELPDAFGRLSKNPVPSIYSAVATPIASSDFDALDFTVDELDSMIYDSYQIDRWGAYIYPLYDSGTDSNVRDNVVSFDNIRLSGQSPVLSTVVTIPCGIGYSSRGNILSEMSLSHFDPCLSLDLVSSNLTMVKNCSKLGVLDKRLSSLAENTVDVICQIQQDMEAKDSRLSFANLPVHIKNPMGVTVKATGSTNSNVIKISQ